jgi:hypothetical protein
MKLTNRVVAAPALDTSESERIVFQNSPATCVAPQALRTLLHEVNRVASVAGDLFRVLRELRVSVDR